MHEMVIYASVDVPVKDAQGVTDFGDLPVCRFNEVTKRMEPVVNTRGLAYANRNQLRYRNKKRTS